MVLARKKAFPLLDKTKIRIIFHTFGLKRTHFLVKLLNHGVFTEVYVLMPIYEYSCDKCGKITEAFQKVSDAPLTICESCQGSLHKLVSKNSFLLKGSGW